MSKRLMQYMNYKLVKVRGKRIISQTLRRIAHLYIKKK
jgi:choline kinase